MRAVAIRNSKWGEIKSKLQEVQSRSDLNEKLLRDINKKPKECKSNFKKWNNRECDRSRRQAKKVQYIHTIAREEKKKPIEYNSYIKLLP